MKKNNVEKERKMHEAYTELLLKEIGMSSEAHSVFVFEKGCEYLEQVCGIDPELKQLLRSKLIWNWWKDQWNARNYYLCLEFAVNGNEPSNALIVEALREAFYEIHNVTSKNIYPSKVLLENSFAEVIGQYIDDLNNNSKEVSYVELR